MTRRVEAEVGEPRQEVGARVTRMLALLFGAGHDVFLSHAHADGRAYAKELEQQLRRRGYDVFRDETELVPGESLPVQLARHARRSAVFVLVGTRGAFVSDWVGEELDAYLEVCGARPRVLCILFEGAQIPDDHRHAPLLRDTLGVEARGPASEPPSVAVLDGIERHFEGVRQRKRRRGAVGLAIASLSAAGLVVRSTFADKEREAKVERWIAAARRAQDDGRFDRAEWAFAEAWWCSGESSADAREGYAGARARRALTPMNVSFATEELALAIDDHDDGYLVVTHLQDEPSFRLNTPTDVETVELDPTDEIFDASIEEGWLTIETLDRMWIQPCGLHRDGRWLNDGDDISDRRIADDVLTLLRHQDERLLVQTLRLPELESICERPLDLPDGAGIRAAELMSDGSVFAAGDWSAPDGGVVPTIWTRAPGIATWETFAFERQLSLEPQTYDARVSPNGRVACLSLSPLDFSGPGAPTPARQLYTRLDDEFGLSWLVHSGNWIPELVETGPIDLVFRTEGGDLRWLERPPVILTEVEPTTLAREVSTFVVWESPDDAFPELVVARESGSLDLLADGQIWSRLPLPSGPVRLLTTERRSLLLADTVDGIRIWKRATSSDGAVPPLAELRSELGPDIVEGWGPDDPRTRDAAPVR